MENQEAAVLVMAAQEMAAVLVAAVLVAAVVVAAVVAQEAAVLEAAVLAVQVYLFPQQAVSSMDAQWTHVRLPVQPETLQSVPAEQCCHWEAHLEAFRTLCRTCITGL